MCGQSLEVPRRSSARLRLARHKRQQSRRQQTLYAPESGGTPHAERPMTGALLRRRSSSETDLQLRRDPRVPEGTPREQPTVRREATSLRHEVPSKMRPSRACARLAGTRHLNPGSARESPCLAPRALRDPLWRESAPQAWAPPLPVPALPRPRFSCEARVEYASAATTGPRVAAVCNEVARPRDGDAASR